jgi:thiol-disulfide isomerase/thioredoxin
MRLRRLLQVVPRAAFAFLIVASVALTSGAEEPNPPDQKPRAGGAIYGRVVDGGGQPIGDAEVSLLRYEKQRFVPEQPAMKTDANGAYRFAGLPESHFTLSVERKGFARAFRIASIEDDQQLPVDLVLKAPASPLIRLTDESGKPVAGARVREFRQRGVNGADYLSQIWLRGFGIQIPASDSAGRLRLPPLPTGDVVDVTIDHPDFAPVRIKNLAVAPDSEGEATLKPGVTVTFRLAPGTAADGPSTAEISLYHETFDKPSTSRLCEIDFGATGTARLTVEPGDYSFLRLEHDDYFLTPQYSPRTGKGERFRIERGRNDSLQFEARRKVSARGRVIEAETGRPLRGMSVLAEIPNRLPGGSDPPPAGDWAYTGFGETDALGEYTVTLAAGKARVSFQGDKYLADADFLEFDAARDGSTVIPEFRVRSLPAVTGVVHDAQGNPLPKAVVRFRGGLRWMQAAVTDDHGRFQLQPEVVPIDDETKRRLLTQPLVAFDAQRPLAARLDVRLDGADDVVLKLQPHDPGRLLTDFTSDLSEWEQGRPSPQRLKEQEAISLRGKPAPELDGILWLNIDRPSLSLADLHGKYVLLDFWSIGCGPCHADFPSVSLVHDMFKDRGVTVISVHDNSQPPEAVRQHVARLKLPFPVVVDHPDGRTLARYQAHGIAQSIPSYVLIGPDGTVLLDDRTIPHPTLRSYKIEIIRQFLLERPPG